MIVRVFRRPASGSSDRKRLKMLPPPSKAGTALESRSPTAGQRRCPLLIAPHRKRNHMSRAGRTTPTVLTDALAEAWPAPADLCAFRAARALQDADSRWQSQRDRRRQPRRRTRQNHCRPPLAARPATRRPVYPGSPLGAPAPRDITSPSPTRSGQSSRDHAPSRSARPASSASRRRQHPAVQQTVAEVGSQRPEGGGGFPCSFDMSKRAHTIGACPT